MNVINTDFWYLTEIKDDLDLTKIFYSNPKNWTDDFENVLPDWDIVSNIGVRCFYSIPPKENILENINLFIDSFSKNNNLGIPEIAFIYNMPKGCILTTQYEKEIYLKNFCTHNFFIKNKEGVYPIYYRGGGYAFNPPISEKYLSEKEFENFICLVYGNDNLSLKSRKKDLVDFLNTLNNKNLYLNYKKEILQWLLLIKDFCFRSENEYRDIKFFDTNTKNSGFTEEKKVRVLVFIKSIKNLEERKKVILKKLITQAINENIEIWSFNQDFLNEVNELMNFEKRYLNYPKVIIENFSVSIDEL